MAPYNNMAVNNYAQQVVSVYCTGIIVIRHSLLVLLLAALYYCSGQLSFSVAVSHSVVTLVVFAAEGFALAAILLGGYRMWPGIFLGQLVLALHNGLDLPASAAISAINSLEAVLGLWLFRHLQLKSSLQRPRDLAGLLLLIFGVLQPFSASLGNTVLWLDDIVTSAAIPLSWLSWWLGNALGQLLITPLLLALWHAHAQGQPWLQQNLSGLLLSLGVAILLFFAPLPVTTVLCFAVSTPLIILLAVRHGLPGACLCLLSLTAAALLATAQGHGPFVIDGQALLLELNIFLLGSALSGLFTAALFQALRERERELDKAQEIAQLGSWSYDPENHSFSGSPQTYRLHQRPPHLPLTLKVLSDAMLPEERPRVAQQWKAALRGEQPYDIEYRLQLGNDIHWVHSRAEMRFSGKRLISCVGTVQDITASKALDQLKSDFVSTVSHELRTPLTSINGAIGLLHGGALGPLTSPQQELLGIAQSNCARLILLINDLLDLDKLASGQLQLTLETHSLLPLLQDSLSANSGYAQQHAIALHLDASDSAAQVRVDPPRLQQVLSNLLSNAIKFSPAGQTVTLRLQVQSGLARIEVCDQGEGVDPAVQPRLFQRFVQGDSSTTRRVAGTGLGLAISKSLVEQMGGRIGLHSEPGRGSTFYVELPLASADNA